MPTIQSFFGVMGIILGSIDVIKQIFQDIAITLGIPTWAVVSATTILSIGFIFAIYRATIGRAKL